MAERMADAGAAQTQSRSTFELIQIYEKSFEKHLAGFVQLHTSWVGGNTHQALAVSNGNNTRIMWLSQKLKTFTKKLKPETGADADVWHHVAQFIGVMHTHVKWTTEYECNSPFMPCTQVSLSPDGSRLVLLIEPASGREKVVMVNVETRNIQWTTDLAEIESAPGQESMKTVGLSFLPDGTKIILCNDKFLRVFDVDQTQMHFHWSTQNKNKNIDVCVSSSLTNQRIAVRDNQNNVLVFDETSSRWNLAHHLQLHGKIIKISLSADGNYVACCGEKALVSVYNLQTNECMWDLQHLANFSLPHFLSVSFSPNSQHLALCGNDGHVRVFDVLAGNELASIMIGDGDCAVVSVLFSPDNGCIASCDADNVMRVFRLKTAPVEGGAGAEASDVEREAKRRKLKFQLSQLKL